ncbi:MAG: hypothetical protein NTX01_03745, partial [Candidatus Omnitrophica bacterium]|nr:hypothetical protein [Candidatus Omnitrophota bacterium]
PWQLIQEKKPDLDKRLLMIPPVDLDAMLVKYANSLAQGGNNVLTDPYPATLAPLPLPYETKGRFSFFKRTVPLFSPCFQQEEKV